MFAAEQFAPGDGWHGLRLQVKGIMGRNDDRTLLLGGHVMDQVAHTVAVAELVVVPADKQ